MSLPDLRITLKGGFHEKELGEECFCRGFYFGCLCNVFGITADSNTGQQLLHLQGFSIGSVADILEKVKDNLPKAAQEAGVDTIVSKWEVAYKNPSIEIVDVTSHLVKLFNPPEQTLKIIEGLSKQPPISLLEALQIKEGEQGEVPTSPKSRMPGRGWQG